MHNRSRPYHRPCRRVPANVTRASFLFCLLLLASCRTASYLPVDIAEEDMCAVCRMAISEKRCAAEYITGEGEPVKFDDIGCMIRAVENRDRKEEIAVLFVVDYETREWLKAEEAFYARSTGLTTPMGSGIVAFKEESKARANAAKYRGKLLRFSELSG